MTTNNQGQPLDIEMTEEIAEGIYTNLAIITHSQGEFILDFAKIMPNVQKGKVKSRIILSPQHAKRMLNALRENIQKYESIHGVIKETNQNYQLGFTGPSAQA